MIIDKPPHIRILEAVKEALETVDYEDRAGVAGVTIRHHRNRHTSKGERPAIAIRWLGNEDQADDQYRNAGERVLNCNIDLVADANLSPEDADADPTGWLKLSLMLAAAFEALRDDGNPVQLLSDWVQHRDADTDEDSKSDEGRLVQAIVVVYRVRTDDPNVLLAQGENYV